MPDAVIDSLPAAGALANADNVVLTQSGTAKKLPYSALKSALSALYAPVGALTQAVADTLYSPIGALTQTAADSRYLQIVNAFTQTAADARYALISAAVALTGNQTIAGIKTFSSGPVLPAGSLSTSVIANLDTYIDSRRGATFVRIVKPGNTSITSSTTPALDPDLTMAVAAGDVWDIDLFLMFEGDTAGDFKWVIDVPTGSTIFGTGTSLSAAATTVSSAQINATISGTPSGNVYAFGTLGAGNDCSGRVSVTVNVGATAGAITVKWAQQTSSAVATILKANSVLTAVKAA